MEVVAWGRADIWSYFHFFGDKLLRHTENGLDLRKLDS